MGCPLAHDFAEQSVVYYTSCQRSAESRYRRGGREHLKWQESRRELRPYFIQSAASCNNSSTALSLAKTIENRRFNSSRISGFNKSFPAFSGKA